MRRLFIRKRWILPFAGCVFFATAVFALSLRYLFPYEDLARSLEARLRTAGIEAKIEGLGPGSLLGVRAKTVTLAFAGQPDPKGDVHDASLAVSLSNLLRFRLRLVAQAQAFGGTVEAVWPPLSPGVATAQWANVDLKRVPQPPLLAGLGIRGRSAGKVEATVNTGSLGTLSGYLDATIADTRVGPGNARGFPLSGVSLGNGQVRFSAKDGGLVVEAARFEGGNLGVTLTGAVDLRGNFPNQRANGLLSLRPDEQAASDLAFLLHFFPSSRTADGTYTARVGGTLGSLVLSPVEGPR